MGVLDDFKFGRHEVRDGADGDAVESDLGDVGPVIDGVLDPDGVLVEGTDDPANNNRGVGLNALARLTTARSGHYCINVSGHSAWTGTYRLTVTLNEQLPVVWSSTLTVGEGALFADGGVNRGGDRFVGYSFFREIPGGAVAERYFDFDGEQRAVDLIGLVTPDGETPTLYLGLMVWEIEDLTMDGLTLYLDGRAFALGDAETFMGAVKFWHWPAPALDWEQGQQVEVTLK